MLFILKMSSGITGVCLFSKVDLISFVISDSS